MVPCRRKTGGDQQRAEFVAVKTGGVRLVIEPRSPDVDRRRVVDETFLLGVAIQAGDRAEPPGHRRPGPPFRFEITALDVETPSSEQPEVTGRTPVHELPQSQRVSLAGQPSVP